MYWVASCGHSWDPSWPISHLSLLNTCSAWQATEFSKNGATHYDLRTLPAEPLRKGTLHASQFHSSAGACLTPAPAIMPTKTATTSATEVASS